MTKVGLKLFETLEYELFEPLQYWLDYDLEYETFLEQIEKGEVIELELEEDEDRAEDLKMLEKFLGTFQKNNIDYELYVFKIEWEKETFNHIV